MFTLCAGAQVKEQREQQKEQRLNKDEFDGPSSGFNAQGMDSPERGGEGGTNGGGHGVDGRGISEEKEFADEQEGEPGVDGESRTRMA